MVGLERRVALGMPLRAGSRPGRAEADVLHGDRRRHGGLVGVEHAQRHARRRLGRPRHAERSSTISGASSTSRPASRAAASSDGVVAHPLDALGLADLALARRQRRATSATVNLSAPARGAGARSTTNGTVPMNTENGPTSSTRAAVRGAAS